MLIACLLTKKYIAKQANKTNVNKRPNILCFIRKSMALDHALVFKVFNFRGYSTLNKPFISPLMV